MNTQEKLRRLQSSRVLAPVDENVLVLLAEAMEEEAYSRGETVFSRGKPADRVYILLDGVLEVSRTGSDEKMAELYPGDLFGVYGLFEGSRTGTVRATAESLILSMDQVRFKSFLFKYPEVMYRILGEAAHRLKAARSRLYGLKKKSSS